MPVNTPQHRPAPSVSSPSAASQRGRVASAAGGRGGHHLTSRKDRRSDGERRARDRRVGVVQRCAGDDRAEKAGRNRTQRRQNKRRGKEHAEATSHRTTTPVTVTGHGRTARLCQLPPPPARSRNCTGTPHGAGRRPLSSPELSWRASPVAVQGERLKLVYPDCVETPSCHSSSQNYPRVFVSGTVHWSLSSSRT